MPKKERTWPEAETPANHRARKYDFICLAERVGLTE